MIITIRDQNTIGRSIHRRIIIYLQYVGDEIKGIIIIIIIIMSK